MGSAIGATLDESCVVSVLNRTVQVKPDGTWVLPNIPANFGPVRARATCVENGITQSGQSDVFTVPANGSANVPPIVLGPVTPIPSQVTVVADGLVTAKQSGTVIVQAIDEGTQGLLRIFVALTRNTDGDRIDDGEEVAAGRDGCVADPLLEDTDDDGVPDNIPIALAGDPRTLLRSPAEPDVRAATLDGAPIPCPSPVPVKPLAASTHPTRDISGAKKTLDVQKIALVCFASTIASAGG
jgi:hypothetical protein